MHDPEVTASAARLGIVGARSIVSRRSVVSSTILLVESFVRLSLVAFISFWIARELGPAQFGVLNYASAVLMVFLSLSTLGLETPVVLRLARGEDPASVIGSGLLLRAALGAICAVLVVLSVHLMRPGEELLLAVAAIAAVSIPLSAATLVDCWFKERNEALRPAFARVIATALSCGVKGFCLWMGWGVVALAWTIAIESALISAFMGVAYFHASRGLYPRRYAAQRAVATDLLRESLPYVISITAIAGYMKADVILLGMLSNNHEVGVYSLCQKLSEVLYVLPVVVVDVLYPSLARRHHAGQQAPGGSAQSFFDVSFAVALLGTLLAIGLVSVGVPWLFGEQYRGTVEIFHLHAWSCIGIAMAHARYKWMAAAGLQRYAPAVTLAGLVAVIALNLLLIPIWGGLGAAVATVSAYAFTGYFISFFFSVLAPAAKMQTRAFWPWLRLYRELFSRDQRAS